MTIHSDMDGRAIDEIATLRGAVDLISTYQAAMVDADIAGFDPNWLQNVAQNVSDLCAVLHEREQIAKRESKPAAVMGS